MDLGILIKYVKKPGICQDCCNPYKNSVTLQDLREPEAPLHDYYYLISCFFIQARDNEHFCSHHIPYHVPGDKLTFRNYLYEFAKIRGYYYDTLDRFTKILSIIILFPIYIIGKYILRRGSDK